MTFSEILAACYEETGNSSSPLAAVVTRIKRLVNEGQRAIFSEPGLQRLLDSDSPLTFASVANTARCVVPDAVARIVRISERTNDRLLLPMDLLTYRTICPDPSAVTGSPTHYVPIGRVAVAKQPSDLSTIVVKSSSAADTTQTAYGEGIRSDVAGGGRVTGSVTLTGTTAASVITASEIEDFYLSAAAVGTVTLHEDSGAGTELAAIIAGQIRTRYTGFYLYPTPSAAVTFYVDYRREITDLVNSADEPNLPTDFHPMLIAYVVMRETERGDNTQRMKAAAARYALWMNRLKARQNLPDELLVPWSRGRRIGRSDLGGMYPAGTIFD